MATRLVSSLPFKNKIESASTTEEPSFTWIIVFTQKLIYTWLPATSLSWSEHCHIFIQRPFKVFLFPPPPKKKKKTVFLKVHYEFTYLDYMHSRLSVYICHFLDDNDNVIIEPEQLWEDIIKRLASYHHDQSVWQYHMLPKKLSLLNQKLQSVTGFYLESQKIKDLFITPCVRMVRASV